ncbi:universal stress protein [Bradyrhizobium ottawaense]
MDLHPSIAALAATVEYGVSVGGTERRQLPDARCHATVIRGHPFDGILRASAAVGADLIVMGAHRK